jgi:putative DNA primase/helicase
LGDIERSRFALSRVPGKTLLTATEQPTGHPKALHVLNALISGEPISIEGKFRDAYSYRPTAKLIWAMNQPPTVADATSGLFRRIRVVAFPRLTVVPDPSLKSRVLDELPGVLAWALEGLREVREREATMRGVDAVFDVPPSVDFATAEYEASQDVVRVFIEDACRVAPERSCKPSYLYAFYREWARHNGYGIKNSRNLYTDLDRLGFESGKSNGVRLRKGIEPDPKRASEYNVSRYS